MSKPKSLRRLIFTWFILFTLLPLGILAFVVQKQYQKSINKQIKDRLTIHVRELESLFAKEREEVMEFLKFVNRDKSFIYYLSTLESTKLKETIAEKIARYSQKKVKIYTYAGQVITYFDGDFKTVHDQGDLSETLRIRLENLSQSARVSFHKKKEGNVLQLSIVQKIIGVQSKTVGYVESYFPIDSKKLQSIRELTNAEIIFFNSTGRVLLSTLQGKVDSLDLEKKLLRGQENLFEFSVADSPFAFISAPMRWGSKKFLIAVGSSKKESIENIRRVNYFIALTFAFFIMFILIMSFFMVREVISPIEALIKATDKMKESREPVHVSNPSRTEIARLVESFNEMSLKISDSENKLVQQLELLESANEKIKSTQNQLVQSAKLASLGELVAGIAHELNNPIGFVYSNIGHLKEYSNSLLKIIDGESTKDDEDYEFIKKDLPKLIQSCEEGSTRAKEIVIGLRNFSRADEESKQAFDVNAGLESTLRLLSGEFKNRIELHKEYGELPQMNGNVNQLKQVFMNILNNACQAVEGHGEIHISTQFVQQDKVIEIRIKDTGIGIPKDQIEKIFDPFYTTKAVGQGTGLGLSITYGIVKSHGGDLAVASQVGHGSEFTIRLPIY